MASLGVKSTKSKFVSLLLKRVIFSKVSFLRFTSRNVRQLTFWGSESGRCGEKAVGKDRRGGGRTLVLWERGFGFERWVTVVSSEFGDFQFLLISQDYSRSRDP